MWRPLRKIRDFFWPPVEIKKSVIPNVFNQLFKPGLQQDFLVVRNDDLDKLYKAMAKKSGVNITMASDERERWIAQYGTKWKQEDLYKEFNINREENGKEL